MAEKTIEVKFTLTQIVWDELTAIVDVECRPFGGSVHQYPNKLLCIGDSVIVNIPISMEDGVICNFQDLRLAMGG